MPTKIDWESQIGRRLRFRDLHVFFTVVQCGSMVKAAAQLGVSAPTVSEVIADLEAGLGVRLLDRVRGASCRPLTVRHFAGAALRLSTS
jgi:molybdenum-dependent DNA-binding transcriptional regulator ModE